METYTMLQWDNPLEPAAVRTESEKHWKFPLIPSLTFSSLYRLIVDFSTLLTSGV